ncbi:MarR family winged helix-turn-helix transcriptional regulator [Methylovirgula sp. 4M-Z18]|uniref:MarR family winged helix-turn-helix transcriptional regulator n=1 Tax=Methylovirgula sp. 4M-Z18 TaxID=2293567 RepID=UPI000E2FE504|nr:MarR family transcriptional regulator [Methylovirgula sp. 4M-Z18]RFB81199.1 MarR family transcriptional regulator [Methylovirgula sp. 4M-Z18]
MAQYDPPSSHADASEPAKRDYILDEQVGFLLRQVNQRHTAIFADSIGDDITPTQWAAVSKLAEKGPCSQNLLGRLTAMDVATIKGVVDRLTKRGLTTTGPDPTDGRRLLVVLTEDGEKLAKELSPRALAITEATLEPLTQKERGQLMALLQKMT